MGGERDDGSDLTGGCLCGAVRYRISGHTQPTGVVYCHCAACRRVSGGPVMVWATFPAAALWLTAGPPASYHSSTRAVRQFCARCGTQLFFAYTTGAPEFDVALGSLDDPDGIAPAGHIWTRERLPWFDTADDLPRHAGDGPEDAARGA